MNCPSCAEPLAPGAAFCEACGTPVGAVAPPAAAPAADVAAEAAPFELTTATAVPGRPAPGTPRPCLQCGGAVGPDGYCESCGSKQPSERDHFREAPADWVAGACDRGIRHSRNEDAMALFATGDRAVLVVLDGVSNTDDSHLASLAGARAARDALVVPMPSGMGTAESRAAAVTRTFAAAVDGAQRSIVALTPEGSTQPPSATFSAVVVEGRTAGRARLHVANIGDSRCYWLPDAGDGVQLTVDDSVAQVQIAAGASRQEAEQGPQGHAITRWLGIDAPDLAPRVTSLDVAGPGWVLNCSDGLWNYASEPQELADQVAAAATTDPQALALALVAFANARGGQDNITAVLARVDAPAGPGVADPGHNAATADEGETDG
ncbi:serine/threonine protein phosphatase [Nocardioides dongxiaopingii]|uniref:double zinc ribbon domain-containing protein n=1 Tax=Nocardioides TaxID=1839 RepID=UPI0010C76CB8|nr:MULTISPECIES: zinc ribbon domain-containing protein [Nocardioides]QDH11049.1 serine/threonine protein phosphatase [Nocardioides sp. S-1144]